MKHTQPSQGFSLIELMIAVAIVGILAAVAYPSYQEYLRDSRRAEAASCLIEIAASMERRYAVNLTYTLDGTRGNDTPGEGDGQGEAFFPNDATRLFSCLSDPTIVNNNFAFTFWFNETHDNAFQARMFLGVNDTCGTLEIDQTGERKVDTGGRGNYDASLVDECW